MSARAALARFRGPGLSTPMCQVLPRNFPGPEDYCSWARRGGDGRWHGPDLRRARPLVRATGAEGATIIFLTYRGDDLGTSAAPAVLAALRAIGYRARAFIVSDAGFGRQVGAGRWNISDGALSRTTPHPISSSRFHLRLAYQPWRLLRPVDRLARRARRPPATRLPGGRAGTVVTSGPPRRRPRALGSDGE
jgi:hypothetical protein